MKRLTAALPNDGIGGLRWRGRAYAAPDPNTNVEVGNDDDLNRRGKIIVELINEDDIFYYNCFYRRTGVCQYLINFNFIYKFLLILKI